MTPLPVDVLLVEDDPADAELILSSLGGDGITERVHVARDGEEALDFVFAREAYADRLAAALPRLILLDIQLPKVTGLDVLWQIKRNERTHAIPVVLLTSSVMKRDVALGYAYGANSYIQKPVDFDAFGDTLRRVCDFWLVVNRLPDPAQ